MAYITVLDDFIFIEGDEPSGEVIGNVTYNKTIWNQQLKSLDDVKKQLKETAVKMGANAIKNFTYGQKSVKWYIAMLLASDDNIKWHGEGTAIKLSEQRRLELINKVKSNI